MTDETRKPETAENEPAAPAPEADDTVESPVDDAAEAAPCAPDIAALRAEVDELKDKLLRQLAETENLRRRTTREIDETRKYAISGFARELLEVSDNLGRALSSVPTEARTGNEFIASLVDGIEMTQRSLSASFERHKIERVEPEKGERFDHNRHQAMFELETSELPPGSIAEVMQVGYVIAERLLRPAMVAVAKAPAQPAAPVDTEAETAEAEPGERIDTVA